MSARPLIWTAVRPRPRGPKFYFVRTKDGRVFIAVLGLPDRTSLPTLAQDGGANASNPEEIAAYAGPLDCPEWRS